MTKHLTPATAAARLRAMADRNRRNLQAAQTLREIAAWVEAEPHRRADLEYGVQRLLMQAAEELGSHARPKL